eukprot:g41400.t1
MYRTGGVDTCLISLDQEKAFDRTSHANVRDMFSKMGFEQGCTDDQFELALRAKCKELTSVKHCKLAHFKVQDFQLTDALSLEQLPPRCSGERPLSKVFLLKFTEVNVKFQRLFSLTLYRTALVPVNRSIRNLRCPCEEGSFNSSAVLRGSPALDTTLSKLRKLLSHPLYREQNLVRTPGDLLLEKDDVVKYCKYKAKVAN